MDAQSIYDQYVQQYGYPPKQPAHLQSYAKQNNMKLSYAQARNAINDAKKSPNDNNTKQKSALSTEKTNTEQKQKPPTDLQQPNNPPPQQPNNPPEPQPQPQPTNPPQQQPNNPPQQQQPNNQQQYNIPSPQQPNNPQQQYNYNQWQQYNQYNQYNAQQYNMQQYNPYAYNAYNNAQQQNWHQQQYNNQYNSYAQPPPHMSPQTSPVQPNNQYNNQYPQTAPKTVQQQNRSAPAQQQHIQQPNTDIPPPPKSDNISPANKINSGYNNTYKSHQKNDTETHLHKNTELDLDFVAELEQPEQNDRILLRQVSPMSNGKYSNIDDITLNNKLETMMNNMGMPNNAKSTIRNQSRHQKIQMIIQYEAQFSTGNNTNNSVENTVNKVENVSNNNVQSQKQISPMSNEKYANIDDITLNQKLEDMMNKMGMPDTAKVTTRKQTRQQKIQMILQFERQFAGSNQNKAPKKSKYAEVNDYFLARKFEGFLNVAQIHIVKRTSMRQLPREKKIQLIDQYECRKGFIQPAHVQQLSSNESNWTDHSKAKVGRDFLGMSYVKEKESQSKNIIDYSIPMQQKPMVTVDKNKLPMKQWNGKNSTSPTSPVSPGGTKRKKKLFKLFDY